MKTLTYLLLDSRSLEVMLAKLEQAKAENETVKVSYTTILFSGSSGVGKTTLLNKLNKEHLNRHHHSTGIAKSKHAICIQTTAVIKSTKGLGWVDLDYDSMISHLNKHLRSLQYPSPTAALPSAKSTLTSSHIPNVTKFKEVDVEIAKADSSKTPSLGDVWEIINFLDTGGQPEFVNILPAVSSSIALTFIVFNLSKRLGSLVHVQHNVDGDPSFVPYHMDCTNLEFIKHLMVSSENFNKNITSPLKSIKRKGGKNNSKICYVGTHAHNIRSEKEIQEIDNQLSSIANELELHKRSFWSSPKQHLERLFPIELFPSDKERELFEDIIEDIRDNIQKQVEKRDYYEVPITWFLFLLKVQNLCKMKQVSYISYQEAVDVWLDNQNKPGQSSDQKLQLESTSREKSDVHNILLFFHFMGILFYYHKVEGMCDYVFINRQWVFEKLTELVESKFTKVYNKKAISAEDFRQFTKEGRLNINVIENLKVDLQGIQPLYFIHLLDHLNIIAPIDAHQKEYFMPCVLPSFPPPHEFIDTDKLYGVIQHVPLLVGFKNGPMPHGFFCHFIVELLRNLPTNWDPPLLSTARRKHVYNNLITFHTNSGHAVSIFYKIGYIEVQVRHRQSQSRVIHFDVWCKLDKALKKVSDHLQLDKMQLCYGFCCNCEEGIKHFAKLEEFTSLPEYIRCDYGYTRLTEDHRVWLQVSMCV